MPVPDALDQPVDRFIRFLATERGLSENYQVNVRRALDRLAAWIAKNRPGTRDWNGVELSDLTDFLAHRKKAGLVAASLRFELIAQKIFFRHLAGRGDISRDVADLLDSPRIEKYLPETLNEPAVEKLIESIDTGQLLGKRDLAIIELLYASGLRVSELTGARLENLSLEDGVIRVTGKGNKTRLVPVGKSARAAVEDYLEFERPELVKPKTSSELFLSVRGQKLSTTRIWQIVKTRARLASLDENVYPHLLRHSFATHLLGNGADLRVIQELLGHADISTTQIYTHVDQKHLRNVHRKFHPRG
ncbi:MAG: site-specific tyrosine recombinase XerD [Verrucomicrobiales bacterium]|nr:site-specific tyrosine recombinase XerD [Verrucomicrobiales bacterium]